MCAGAYGNWSLKVGVNNHIIHNSAVTYVVERLDYLGNAKRYFPLGDCITCLGVFLRIYISANILITRPLKHTQQASAWKSTSTCVPSGGS